MVRPATVVQPIAEVGGLKDNRHAIMHIGDEVVGLGDDHGTRLQRLASRAVLPFVQRPANVIGWASARVK
jgi:hypothetical protein